MISICSTFVPNIPSPFNSSFTLILKDLNSKYDHSFDLKYSGL